MGKEKDLKGDFVEQALTISREDIQKKFEEFFSDRKKEEVEELASSYPKDQSLEVHFNELALFDHELADHVVKYPDKFLPAAQEALRGLYTHSLIVSRESYKPHLRIHGLPDVHSVSVQSLGAESLDKLVKVEGAVSWITDIYPRILTAVWECVHCWQVMLTSPQKTEPVKPPLQCKCGRNNFKLLEEKSEFVNMQRSRMQEMVEKLRGSAPTSHVDLWLENDLVNLVSPGEKLIATGILRLKPNKEGRSKSTVYSKYLEVMHVAKLQQEFELLEITKQEEEKIKELSRQPDVFEKIVHSIAPSIYGYNELKEAIALQLFGGTPGKKLPDGHTIRNDVHILLCGDPGTGKSAVLQYVVRLAPKGIFTSGKGSSAVGMTASAEKDELTGGWILKAGAMVLGSGGTVMIDEFDKMNEEDRSALHEALEQQQISIAKAGIITTFQTKTSVLAAANPKYGRFDPNSPPSSQFDIPPTLLSRFDLIFTIKDVLDESHDRKLAEHIILGHTLGSTKEAPAEDSAILPVIGPDLLRKYIAYSRRTMFPILTPEANEKIKDFYLELRRLGKKSNTFPVTARQIEGVIRLAEASAKVRLSPRVELQDAERAIGLVTFVLHDVFMDKETGVIDSDIISIGQPKSKVDKLRTFMNIVSSLEKQFDVVDIDEVVKECVLVNIDEHTTRKMIEDLKRQGDLYEPKPGFIKTARKKGEW
ncbi:minichromosome maintenance protein MCM [Candidatus Micrarchaeota archaeon]|nr:minichromosome maintenance protein MCM [Candidatus Micrarchaeota archaeon]